MRKTAAGVAAAASLALVASGMSPAAAAKGTTPLSNIASWRVKETDRIAAMAAELRRVGATVTSGEDFIEVTPPGHWQPAVIRTYDDHRMAMCLALAAFNPLAGGHAPLRIEDPRCVAKTFPDYFEALFSVATAAPDDVPVITIDGPTASGKGTLAAAVAAALGWHLLDSGALYRAAGLATQWDGVDPDKEAEVARLCMSLDLHFEAGRAWLRGRDVTDELRLESTGVLASRVSVHPAVRGALHDAQLAFRRAPGLVADGRDMGTVIFPGAALKVFLTASPAERAERRHKQLISKGISASIEDLRADLEARDARDKSRSAAPLKPAEDALLLDNSHLSIEASVQQLLAWWQSRRPAAFAAGAESHQCTDLRSP